MKAFTITDHLILIRQLGFINAYLVREADGFTLIDTLLRGSGAGIRAITGATPIRRIVLTHNHSDHSGGLDELAAALPGVEIVLNERTAALLAGDHREDPALPGRQARAANGRCASKATRTLRPGERVGSLEVIDAKGHAVDQIAFLDTRDRSLICGDAFSSVGGLAISGEVWLPFPVFMMVNWNRDYSLQTARALRGLDPARIAVGHGPVIEAPAQALDRAITRATRAFEGS